MDITVVEATLQDYDWFVEVFREVEELHRIKEPTVFKKPEGELFSKEYFKKLVTEPHSTIFLAKEEGHVVGYAIAYKKKNVDIPVFQPRERVQIDDIVVKKSSRGKWIGKLLMEKVEYRAREEGIADIELNVRTFNKCAIGFYEKFGFSPFSQKMRKKL